MAYTPAQAAKLLESKYDAEGYGPADVKVSVDPYSLGSTVYVTIQRLGVRLEPIDRIAREHLELLLDERNEILLGWNRHVDVRYARAALAPLVAEALERIRDLPVGQTRELGGCIVTRAGGTIYSWEVEIKARPEFTPRAYERARGAALFIAQHAAAAGRKAIP
jgi:hypothetical protein